MRLVAAGTMLVSALAVFVAIGLDSEPVAAQESGSQPALMEIETDQPPTRANPQETSPSTSDDDLPDEVTVLADAADLPPGGTFFDDDENLHEGAIEAIAAAGITRGCGEVDLFCPARPVTRGELAAFLRRALDLAPSSAGAFTDSSGSIFAADIAALAATGITNGCGPEAFCPDDVVTRGEMAAFLRRAFQLPAGEDGAFTDVAGSIFASDIAALATAGITRGCGEEVYCPDRPVLRDQMASFLARALGLPTDTPPPRPSVTIAFTGDILIHAPVWRRAAVHGSPYDFRPMFAPVADIIRAADLAICHLEVPLSADNSRISGYPLFNAPRQVADAVVASGYDGCSTASNHSFDQGVRGIEDTLSVFADVGLGQAGMFAVPEASGRATVYDVDGVTVAHLAATWWLNGLRLPADKPWLVQMLEVDELVAQAQRAREEGADVVVVSMHCCVEYQTMPTPYQREVARTLIASSHIDLVVGHHAHVVQPIEGVDGKLIVYGLGNFLSAQRSNPSTQDGVIVSVEFALRSESWATRGVQVVPTWVEGGTYRILPAAAANDASWRRTARAIRLDDALGVEVIR